METTNHSTVVGYGQRMGRRETMEDRIIIEDIGDEVFLYAVADGHGGEECADYIKEKLPNVLRQNIENLFDPDVIKKIFLDLDTAWYNSSDSRMAIRAGTTFTGILVDPTRIMVINLGDSRTLLFSKDESIVSTVDHKATNNEEWQKCVQRGGEEYLYKNVRYVNSPTLGNGCLAVTRSFGDKNYKRTVKMVNYGLVERREDSGYLGTKAVVSPEPDADVYDRSEYTYAVLMSDGVSDVVPNDDIDIVLKTEDRTTQELADLILAHAYYSSDNASVIVIKL